jgi:hypothetical protein
MHELQHLWHLLAPDKGSNTNKFLKALYLARDQGTKYQHFVIILLFAPTGDQGLLQQHCLMCA